MENPTVSGLRSRSRSKTPFLRSSCDHENCVEGDEEHGHHKSGRKTPVKRSTPVKQLIESSNKVTTTETIAEEIGEYMAAPPAFSTRQSMKNSEKMVKTSDYSSEESLDRLRGNGKEVFQNEINSQYERVSNSSQRYATLADVTLSPIHTSHNVTQERSFRIGSPAYSACSTDSSFAEQALADTSLLLDRNPSAEHLPSRLYKMAGEYWNKYPKTDYTYSPLSKDRVELAPGQVAMPNMSRRSLSQFRVQGPFAGSDEIDRLTATSAWTATLNKQYSSVDSSDDETSYRKVPHPPEQRWWLTRLLVSIITTVTTTTSNAYRKMVGPSHRYPYTDRRPQKAGLATRAAAATVLPFYWIYTVIKSVITTTVTTVTETISPNQVGESRKYLARAQVKQAGDRSRWPWLLLLALPIVGYGSHYTYENWDRFAMPNFTDFHIDMSEFTTRQLAKISLPNVTMPNLLPNITMPQINITLPDITDRMPEVTKTYREYKEIVQNRVVDASDYMVLVGESCFEELKRYWRGIIG